MTQQLQPIGLIDSGVGGLTVAKQLLKQLPNESIIYLGDNARCPYGVRSDEEIITFTFELAEFLMKKGIKLLVIACNTATAVALKQLQHQLPIPVIGVIDSGVRASLAATKNKRIGVIATPATIDSQVYQTKIHELDSSVEVLNLACPELVDLVEGGNYPTAESYAIVCDSLTPLFNQQLDTVVLGCTHYPLLELEIQAAFGPEVRLINSGKETIRTVREVLAANDLRAPGTRSDRPTAQYYTTGSTDRFHAIASHWLETDSLDVRKLHLTGGYLHEEDLHHREP